MCLREGKPLLEKVGRAMLDELKSRFFKKKKELLYDKISLIFSNIVLPNLSLIHDQNLFCCTRLTGKFDLSMEL